MSAAAQTIGYARVTTHRSRKDPVTHGSFSGRQASVRSTVTLAVTGSRSQLREWVRFAISKTSGTADGGPTGAASKPKDRNEERPIRRGLKPKAHEQAGQHLVCNKERPDKKETERTSTRSRSTAHNQHKEQPDQKGTERCNIPTFGMCFPGNNEPPDKTGTESLLDVRSRLA